MLNSNRSARIHFKSFLVFVSSGYYALESGPHLTPPTLRITEHAHIGWRTATYIYIYTYIYIRTYLKSRLNTNMTELARFARSLIINTYPQARSVRNFYLGCKYNRVRKSDCYTGFIQRVNFHFIIFFPIQLPPAGQKGVPTFFFWPCYR